MRFLQLCYDVGPAHPWQYDIADDQGNVSLVLFGQLDCNISARRLQNGVTALSQELAGDLPQRILVFQKKDGFSPPWIFVPYFDLRNSRERFFLDARQIDVKGR